MTNIICLSILNLIIGKVEILLPTICQSRATSWFSRWSLWLFVSTSSVPSSLPSVGVLFPVKGSYWTPLGQRSLCYKASHYRVKRGHQIKTESQPLCSQVIQCIKETEEFLWERTAAKYLLKLMAGLPQSQMVWRAAHNSAAAISPLLVQRRLLWG